MTKDEEKLFRYAEKIKQYCQERRCYQCIFAEDECVMQEVPEVWELEKVEVSVE